jgi:hypothetical protein
VKIKNPRYRQAERRIARGLELHFYVANPIKYILLLKRFARGASGIRLAGIVTIPGLVQTPARRQSAKDPIASTRIPESPPRVPPINAIIGFSYA